MSPKEKPSFFLYSIGYPPNQITLGTLVYRDYANPTNRYIPFPVAGESELANQNLISITNFGDSCWANTKSSKYGLGLQALDLASVTTEYATSLRKIVRTKKGRRVVLNQPVKFFENRVLKDPDIQRDLVIWLTAAKGSYLFKTATFQKPKVYCVTGFYELVDVRARISSSSEATVGFSVTPAPGVIPIGLEIGPFADGKSLKATYTEHGTGIWAARFHQLDVEYIRAALQGQPEPSLPTTIRLRPDVTNPGGGIMAGRRQEEGKPDNRVLVGGDVQLATAARLGLDEGVVEEMDEDYRDGDEYDNDFQTAEKMIRADAAADAAAGDEDDE